MASIRKRGDKWQVQVRRLGVKPLVKSFLSRKDAEAWARHIEILVDRAELPSEPRQLERHTLGDLVSRYLKSVSPGKLDFENEKFVLRAFMRHSICRKRLSDLTVNDFARYRDERLKTIKPRSLKRQLSPIQNLFEIARDEWGLPIKQNFVRKLRFKAPDRRRERKLNAGDLQRLLEAGKATKNPFILPIIELAVETGMRRSELLAMRWNHIQEAQRGLLVPLSKNG